VTESRLLPRWELDGVRGAVVVVDVLRAFTTAAYALAAGACEIWLVDSIDEAFAFKAARPGSVAMGERGGRRPDGFELSNSPVQVAEHDLSGKVIVQCTGAGTRGVVAAADADRLWAASLVCASATAAAVDAAGLGPPTYVITGRFPDQPAHRADDDVETARLIERARCDEPLAVVRHGDRARQRRPADPLLVIVAGLVLPLRGVELGLRPLVGDVEQEREEADRQGHEQHLVPAALVSHDHVEQHRLRFPVRRAERQPAVTEREHGRGERGCGPYTPTDPNNRSNIRAREGRADHRGDPTRDPS